MSHIVPMGARITIPHRQLDFILAGKAIFTIHNPETRGRFTYKVVKSSKMKDTLFVSILTRPDNVRGWSKLGLIRPNGKFVVPRKWRIGMWAPSAEAFAWIWSNVRRGKPVDPAEFWHQGRCARCGRRLTVPESIETGFGPECARRVGIVPKADWFEIAV